MLNPNLLPRCHNGSALLPREHCVCCILLCDDKYGVILTYTHYRKCMIWDTANVSPSVSRSYLIDNKATAPKICRHIFKVIKSHSWKRCFELNRHTCGPMRSHWFLWRKKRTPQFLLYVKNILEEETHTSCRYSPETPRPPPQLKPTYPKTPESKKTLFTEWKWKRCPLLYHWRHPGNRSFRRRERKEQQPPQQCSRTTAKAHREREIDCGMRARQQNGCLF